MEIIEIIKNCVPEDEIFYQADDCYEASKSITSTVDDIKQSISFLKNDLAGVHLGCEDVFIGYAKIYSCLTELEQLKELSS